MAGGPGVGSEKPNQSPAVVGFRTGQVFSFDEVSLKEPLTLPEESLLQGLDFHSFNEYTQVPGKRACHLLHHFTMQGLREERPGNRP